MKVQLSAAIVAILISASQCLGGVVVESEANDTLAAAQSLDGLFSLEFNENIGDTAANTSTTMPHVTVMGFGDNTFDFYSFTIASPGQRGIFDIDFAYDGSGYSDMSMHLFKADGTWLASNTNSSAAYGALGSTTHHDPYLEYVFSSAGVYVLGLAQEYTIPLPVGRLGGSPVKPGKNYQLQVSVPEPSAWVGGIFAACTLGLLAWRRR